MRQTRCISHFISLIFFLSSNVAVESFVIVGPFRKFRTNSSLNVGKERLVFSGECILKSEPFSGCNREQIVEYFNKPTTQLFLISAGGKRQVTRFSPVGSEFVDLWQEACRKTGEKEFLPKNGDEALSVDSIIQFPGLQQITTVLNGVKRRTDPNGFPEYIFVLIGEKKRIFGPSALVWIYNKLTRLDKEDPDRYRMPDAKATSVASVGEEPNGSFTFQIHVTIQIFVEFPATLVKILPASKEKMEQQGSAAVLKAITADIMDSLRVTRDEFLRQLE